MLAGPSKLKKMFKEFLIGHIIWMTGVISVIGLILYTFKREMMVRIFNWIVDLFAGKKVNVKSETINGIEVPTITDRTTSRQLKQVVIQQNEILKYLIERGGGTELINPLITSNSHIDSPTLRFRDKDGKVGFDIISQDQVLMVVPIGDSALGKSIWFMDQNKSTIRHKFNL